MNFDLTNLAEAEQLKLNSINWWTEMATKSGVDLSDFNPDAPLEERIAWALRAELSIESVYSRCSCQMQQSIDGQVRESIQWAARNGSYVPPEFVVVEEGVRGRGDRP